MKSKKTISIFSQNSPPSSLADSIRIKPIVDYFVENDFEVVLYTCTKNSVPQEEIEVKILNWIDPNNKDHFIVRLLKELFLGVELTLKIILNKKTNFYLLSSPPFLTCMLASWAVKIKKGKLIFDIRDLYPDIYIKQDLISEKGMIGRVLNYLEKQIYDSCFFILTVTEGLYKEVSERTTSRVFILRNGFNDFFRDDLAKFLKFTVVFHGNLGRFQNIELLINVANYFKGDQRIQFIVIGSGPKEGLLKDEGVNIDYRGRLDNEQTASIVNRCHLGISLRDDSKISADAFPVKIYEYIGSGIPCIVTPISEGGRILRDEKVGFNLSNEMSSIVDAINTLLTDNSMYKEMRLRIKDIRKAYSRTIIVRDVLDSVFRQLGLRK